MIGFARNFVAKQIQGHWFKIRNMFSNCSPKIHKKGIFGQKYPKKSFLVQNLGIYYFTKFCKYTNSRELLLNITILFSNSSPKEPKWGIFCPKFSDFYFCIIINDKTNLRTLISNMTMIISSSSPKIRKSGIFGLKFKVFCFSIKLCNKANSRELIPDMTLVFQNSCPKHPNKTFLVPNLRFLIFARNFVQSDK